MGEGMDTDAAIMPFVSSVNIACGFHAGDRDIMKRTVAGALAHNLAIGAHPSYPDRENFGRIDILGSSITLNDLPAMLEEQIVTLHEICAASGARLHHVKPHGALYNRAAKDADVAAVICGTIFEINPELILYGLSGSEMKRQADQRGLRFINEVFADRTYQADGSLTPRTSSNALIESQETAIRQVLKMVREGKVSVVSGVPEEIPILAETICIHGDGSHAVDFARMIHDKLLQYGIEVRARF